MSGWTLRLVHYCPASTDLLSCLDGHTCWSTSVTSVLLALIFYHVCMDKKTGPLVFNSVLPALIFYHVCMDTQTGPLVFNSVLSTLIFYHVWMDTQTGPLVFNSVLSTLIF
ncbi:hypothetical protein RRG08_054013 [Elysia crispata]|uniref:Uncharacterized protein n=1 Tax=Elysia crispata TaxID=231223 RepID=A0AAE0Z9W7_9GAST|nr:hypothetical protein RRG08_054013 [Elysia crispata]